MIKANLLRNQNIGPIRGHWALAIQKNKQSLFYQAANTA